MYPLVRHFDSLEKNHRTRSGSYNDPRGGAILGPRGMTGRILVELHMTLLHIKYTSFVSCGCREYFFMHFHYKCMVDNDMPGAWPFLTPGPWLAGFIKRATTHCYTQNMKGLGLVISQKIFFMFFPLRPHGRGLYEPRARDFFFP